MKVIYWTENSLIIIFYLLKYHLVDLNLFYFVLLCSSEMSPIETSPVPDDVIP
jgi:hypothetical protein